MRLSQKSPFDNGEDVKIDEGLAVEWTPGYEANWCS